MACDLSLCDIQSWTVFQNHNFWLKFYIMKLWNWFWIYYEQIWSHGFLEFYIQKITHWDWDKMAAIFQTTYSTTFSWMKEKYLQSKFHWSMFQSVQLTILQHWSVPSHYLNQWWLGYQWIYASLCLNELTHCSLVMPYGIIDLDQQCFKSWFIACSGTSCYLNQC